MWAQRERVAESHPGGILNYFNGAFLPRFLWPIVLICLTLSPHLVCLRVLLLCAHTSLSQDGFYWKGLWVVHITYYEMTPSLFLTSKVSFCIRVVREISWPREWGKWSLLFLSLICAGLSASSIIPLLWSFCYYAVSGHRGETIQPGAIYLLPP